MNKFCTGCGQPLPADVKFCGECGTAGAVRESASPNRRILAPLADHKWPLGKKGGRDWKGTFGDFAWWQVALLPLLLFGLLALTYSAFNHETSTHVPDNNVAATIRSALPDNSRDKPIIVASKPATDVPARQNRHKDAALGARLAYVELLTAVFKGEGRLIGVSAVGDNQTILQLNSGLMGRLVETHTKDAAREVVTAPESLMILRRAKFTMVVLRDGYDVFEQYKL